MSDTTLDDDGQSSASWLIRDATLDDCVAMVAIYNPVVQQSTAVWSETPQTVEQREQWFNQLCRNNFPVLVACEREHVVGFAAFDHFRGGGRWPGYRHTVEHTIFVHPNHQGRRVGTALLNHLFERARVLNMHIMVAAIDADNLESIHFHQRQGFTITGRMPQVGRKFDRWLDLVLMQKTIDLSPDHGG